LVGLAVVCAVVALWRGRRRVTAEWAWLGMGVPLLFAFAQTMNINHGGTPGMSRYALWMIPLAAPLVDAAHRRSDRPGRLVLAAAVSLSCLWNTIYFAPSRPEGFLTTCSGTTTRTCSTRCQKSLPSESAIRSPSIRSRPWTAVPKRSSRAGSGRTPASPRQRQCPTRVGRTASCATPIAPPRATHFTSSRDAVASRSSGSEPIGERPCIGRVKPSRSRIR
jgi:hypothetical protein